MANLEFDYDNSIELDVNEDEVGNFFDENDINIQEQNPVEVMRKVIRWLRDLGDTTA